jgi:hypothetical protein
MILNRPNPEAQIIEEEEGEQDFIRMKLQQEVIKANENI